MTTLEFEAHQQAKRLFDETASNYLQRSRGAIHKFSSLIFRRRITIVEKFIAQFAKAGGEVLDYGMGPAVFARCCVALDMRYLGIDISPEMVACSKELGLPNAEYIVGDLETLDSYQSQKDLVLAIGLIDYLENVPDGIARLAACVRPDGHLILSFRNRYSVPRALRDGSKVVLRNLPIRTQSSKKAFFAKVHEKSFDVKRHLIPELTSLGFRDFEARYFNCSPMFFDFPRPNFVWRSWYAADEVLASPNTRFLCSGGVMAARKSV
jgi:SAM-dependent methyltransferase